MVLYTKYKKKYPFWWKKLFELIFGFIYLFLSFYNKNTNFLTEISFLKWKISRSVSDYFKDIVNPFLNVGLESYIIVINFTKLIFKVILFKYIIY